MTGMRCASYMADPSMRARGDLTQSFTNLRQKIQQILCKNQIPVRGFSQRVLNSRTCQHCDVKTSTVTPTFYYFFIIFLTCYISVPSCSYNLCQVLLLRNRLKKGISLKHKITVFFYASDCVLKTRTARETQLSWAVCSISFTRFTAQSQIKTLIFIHRFFKSVIFQ